MRRFMLKSGHCWTVTLLSGVFLLVMLIVRSVAWNDYSVWRGGCRVNGASLGKKGDQASVSLELTCDGKEQTLFDQKKVLAFATGKLPKVLQCTLSKNDTINCK